MRLWSTMAVVAACGVMASCASKGAEKPVKPEPFGQAVSQPAEPVRPVSPAPAAESELERLTRYMCGTFSSREQAGRSSDVADIRLFVTRVWQDAPEVWLYVEQARATQLDKPYRQRMYRLKAQADGTLHSDVFTLPGRELDYAGAWRAPARLRGLTPQTVTVREGCTIAIRAEGDAFVGATIGTECPSDLRGAAYAVSQVRITELGTTSWDRGYDKAGKQVWGSETGYEFVRDPDAATPAAVRR